MEVSTIAENLFFTTIRITGFDSDGNLHSGTGFFFKFSNEKQSIPFIVTNRHVVRPLVNGTLHFVKSINGKPHLGEGFSLTLEPPQWADLWFNHPIEEVDISICPLVPIEKLLLNSYDVIPFYRTIDKNNAPTKEQVSQLDAIEPVTFVGYPNGLWDSKNYLPIVRQGITATPIYIPFEDTETFLVDASVFPGSSGSPVFSIKSGTLPTRDGNFIVGSQFYFLGVLTAVFTKTSLNEIIPAPAPTAVPFVSKQTEVINIGIVLRWTNVIEIVNAFLKKANIHFNA